MTLLQAAGVPAAAMLRVSELPAFPYYTERRLFRLSGHPHIRQSFCLENAPVRSGRRPDPPDNPASLLGEHNERILRAELGLTDTETAALLSDNGRIAGASR